MSILKNYEYKTPPFKHQLNALLKSADKRNFAYFMEMGCVDGETEFLTQRGWVKFKDFDLETWERPLLVAEAIPAVKDNEDLSKWSYKFVEPTAYIKKPAYEWIHLEGLRRTTSSANRGDEFVMTPDHNIPINYYWALRAMGKLYPRHIPMPDATAGYLHQCTTNDPDRFPKFPIKCTSTSFGYVARCTEGFGGFESEYFVPDPELSTLNEWELRFMVAVIADGTYPNTTNNKVDFYFMKERKVDRLIMLAAKAGIDMAYEKSNRGEKTIHIFHAIAPMRTKVFDEKWYSLSHAQLKAVAEEVFYWDGWSGDADSSFYTNQKASADFVQYALMATGSGSKIHFDMKKRLYKVLRTYNECYHKSMMPMGHEHRYVEPCLGKPFRRLLKTKKVDEERMSYCFRVSSGYLLLRRNNHIFVSGNSGKTKVMIDNIGVLYQEGHITGALVLAPKGVYRNWSDKEIPTHLPDNINRELIVWDAAASPGRKDYLMKQVKKWDGKTLQIMVFNIESLNSATGKKLITEFIKKHDGNIFALVDESTCIKNHKAKRTKEAIEIGSKCKVKRIATGSPITNSPLDLFSQCAFLSKGLLGYGSYYAFKNTFAEIEKVQNRQGQHYEKILAYKNLDKLSTLVEKFSYRVTKKECLDLPEKIYMTRHIDLTPEQIRIYKEMKDHQFSLIQKDKEVLEMSVQVVLTKLLRLHQILCGTFTSDDGVCERIPNNRITALKEVLEETNGKVIIWATYLADIKAICEALKEEYGEDSFVTYYGEVSADDRVKAIQMFQDENSPVRFFVGNVQTAGKGITLTAANTVVYYSNNFSLELRQQSEDRAHRIGQKNPVTYIDFVVKGSLDEKIINSLINKRDIANAVLQDDLDSWISLTPQ